MHGSCSFSTDMRNCIEGIYGCYESETIIRLDTASSGAWINENGFIEQVCERIRDCANYDSLYSGLEYRDLTQYIKAQPYPEEEITSFLQRLNEAGFIKESEEPAVFEREDAEGQLHTCIQQIADRFLKWDALPLLDRVLTDDKDEPEYSAITASKWIELSRQFQVLYYGRSIPDLSAFLEQYGYDQSAVYSVYKKCIDEDWRYRDWWLPKSFPFSKFYDFETRKTKDGAPL